MLSKDDKKKIIKGLSDMLLKQKAVMFFDYTGLKVNQFQKLRSKLREEGIDCLAAKKTLVGLSLEKANLKGLNARELEGQLGLVFGYEDEVMPAKILYDFSKENKDLRILAGIVNGEVLANEAIISLAKLPSKQDLLAQMVGSISSPLFGLVNNLAGNLRKLIYIIKSLEEQKA